MGQLASCDALREGHKESVLLDISPQPCVQQRLHAACRDGCWPAACLSSAGHHVEGPGREVADSHAREHRDASTLAGSAKASDWSNSPLLSDLHAC